MVSFASYRYPIHNCSNQPSHPVHQMPPHSLISSSSMIIIIMIIIMVSPSQYHHHHHHHHHNITITTTTITIAISPQETQHLHQQSAMMPSPRESPDLFPLCESRYFHCIISNDWNTMRFAKCVYPAYLLVLDLIRLLVLDLIRLIQRGGMSRCQV